MGFQKTNPVKALDVAKTIIFPRKSSNKCRTSTWNFNKGKMHGKMAKL
jgi:hypothetical protein